jgi:hypothetical protein
MSYSKANPIKQKEIESTDDTYYSYEEFKTKYLTLFKDVKIFRIKPREHYIFSTPIASSFIDSMIQDVADSDRRSRFNVFLTIDSLNVEWSDEVLSKVALNVQYITNCDYKIFQRLEKIGIAVLQKVKPKCKSIDAVIARAEGNLSQFIHLESIPEAAISMVASSSGLKRIKYTRTVFSDSFILCLETLY